MIKHITDFFISVFPGFFIKTVENWYGQNRTGRTARSGLGVCDKLIFMLFAILESVDLMILKPARYG